MSNLRKRGSVIVVSDLRPEFSGEIFSEFAHVSSESEHELSETNKAHSFVVEEIEDVIALSWSDIDPLVLYHLRELLDS